MANFGNAPHDADNIQDLWYALAEADLLSGTLKDDTVLDDAFKTHGYSLQPDGDLVGSRADGEAFSKNGGLAANETFTSDWIDTDGWRTIEIFVESDVQSAENGVEVQFSRDIQATTPKVDATQHRTYANEAVDDQFVAWNFAPKLDGFRLKYTNGDTATFDNFTIVATLRSIATPDSADYVDANPVGDSFITVGTDPSIKGVGISEPASLFGDLQTIERQTVIDATSTFGTSVLRDEVTSTGSGSVEEDPAPSGEIHIGTGTTANSSIELQTAEFGRYTPGFSAQQGCGIRLGSLFTEGEARWGYFTDANGFYWGYDGSQQEMFIARRKGGVETERVYRSNWNRSDLEDELNRPWDPTQGDIYQIDFSWYGYGLIIFSIVSQVDNDNLDGTPNQKTVPVHAIAVENESSTADPNQPIRVTAENAGNGEDIDVYVGGRQFSVFGEPPAEQRVTSQNVSTVSVDETAWVHLMSWRRDPSGTANSKFNILSFDALQTGDTKYALVVDANISGTTYATPELTNSNETLLEVSTVGSFDGIGTGTKIWETLAVGGGGQRTSGAAADINVRLGQDKVVTLLARGVDASSTVDATMRMKEDW